MLRDARQPRLAGSMILLFVIALSVGSGAFVALSSSPATEFIAGASVLGAAVVLVATAGGVASIGLAAGLSLAMLSVLTVTMSGVRPFPEATLSDVLMLPAAILIVPTTLASRNATARIPVWLALSVGSLLAVGLVSSVGSDDPSATCRQWSDTSAR